MYNILYDREDGTTHKYCRENMGLATAEWYLMLFIERYMGKPYPNGKGHYTFSNPRVVRVN